MKSIVHQILVDHSDNKIKEKSCELDPTRLVAHDEKYDEKKIQKLRDKNV
jgi:hypothetical protein